MNKHTENEIKIPMAYVYGSVNKKDTQFNKSGEVKKICTMTFDLLLLIKRNKNSFIYKSLLDGKIKKYKHLNNGNLIKLIYDFHEELFDTQLSCGGVRIPFENYGKPNLLTKEINNKLKSVQKNAYFSRDDLKTLKEVFDYVNQESAKRVEEYNKLQTQKKLSQKKLLADRKKEEKEQRKINLKFEL